MSTRSLGATDTWSWEMPGQRLASGGAVQLTLPGLGWGNTGCFQGKEPGALIV